MYVYVRVRSMYTYTLYGGRVKGRGSTVQACGLGTLVTIGGLFVIAARTWGSETNAKRHSVSVGHTWGTNVALHGKDLQVMAACVP